MARRSRITIRDVATKAGISHQTVSRVINNSDHVLPATHVKVEAALVELDYTPNAIAPNLTDYTLASLINGAETEVRKHGYFLLSASAPDGDTFAALIDELVSSQRAKAIMVFNPNADDRHQYLPLISRWSLLAPPIVKTPDLRWHNGRYAQTYHQLLVAPDVQERF